LRKQWSAVAISRDLKEIDNERAAEEQQQQPQRTD
jgi:hypothetical protein